MELLPYSGGERMAVKFIPRKVIHFYESLRVHVYLMNLERGRRVASIIKVF